MGSVFVERFSAAGEKVLVYDVSDEAVQRAKGFGATPCSSPAALARECDVVDVMVRNDKQMLDVCLGKDGVLEGLASGKVLLLHSSTQPHTTRKIAEAAAKQGIPVADACITAIPAVLRAGNGACLFGGDPQLLEQVKPHLLRLVKQVFYMGPLGCGNIAKGVRNMINISEQLLVKEGFDICEAAGITHERARAMMQHIYASRSLDGYETFQPSGPAGNLFETILPIAERAADDHGVKAPLTHLLASADAPLA